MRLAAFDRACGALPATFKTIQWRGAHVWKVGDAAAFRMFAVGAPETDGDEAPCPITLKVGEAIHPILMELEGVGRAPHLPSGGWLRVEHPSAIDDATLAGHLATSHRLAVAGLTRRVRVELGLADPH